MVMFELFVEESSFIPVVLTLAPASSSPGGLVKTQVCGPYSQSLRFGTSRAGLEMCISAKSSGDADAVGLGTPLGEPLSIWLGASFLKTDI